MRLSVNGEDQTFAEGSTVGALVEELGCGDKGVAVAVNRTVVPRSRWAQHQLRDDDRVEVLRAAQGG